MNGKATRAAIAAAILAAAAAVADYPFGSIQRRTEREVAGGALNETGQLTYTVENGLGVLRLGTSDVGTVHVADPASVRTSPRRALSREEYTLTVLPGSYPETPPVWNGDGTLVFLTNGYSIVEYFTYSFAVEPLSPALSIVDIDIGYTGRCKWPHLPNVEWRKDGNRCVVDCHWNAGPLLGMEGWVYATNFVVYASETDAEAAWDTESSPVVIRDSLGEVPASGLRQWVSGRYDFLSSGGMVDTNSTDWANNAIPLVPPASVYPYTLDDVGGGIGDSPEFTADSIPYSNGYYDYEAEICVPTNIVSATYPRCWEWPVGIEPPAETNGLAGSTIRVSVRFDCMARTHTVRSAVLEPVPYDAVVEWLDNQETGFVDTGVHGSATLSFDIRIGFGSTGSMGMDDDPKPPCASNGGASFYFGPRNLTSGQFYIKIGFDTSQARFNTGLSSLAIGTPHTLKATAGEGFYADANNFFPGYGSAITNSLAGWTAQNMFHLFSKSANDLHSRIWYARFWEAVGEDPFGLPLRDYIPVRVGTTGYLYDRVTKKLYGFKGGAPLVGPDVWVAPKTVAERRAETLEARVRALEETLTGLAEALDALANGN